MGVAHVRPLSEQGIGLIEQQDRVRTLGCGEDTVEVLLGLPDVLRHDGGQVDAKQLEAKVVGQYLRRHRLAGAGLPGEQDLEPLAAADRVTVTPFGEYQVAVSEIRGYRTEQLELARRQYQVAPVKARRHVARQLAQASGRCRPRAGVEVGFGDPRIAPSRGGELRDPGGVLNLADRQPELGGHVTDVRRARVLLPGRDTLPQVRERNLDEHCREIVQRECPIAPR